MGWRGEDKRRDFCKGEPRGGGESVKEAEGVRICYLFCCLRGLV